MLLAKLKQHHVCMCFVVSYLITHCKMIFRIKIIHDDFTLVIVLTVCNRLFSYLAKVIFYVFFMDFYGKCDIWRVNSVLWMNIIFIVHLVGSMYEKKFNSLMDHIEHKFTLRYSLVLLLGC